MQLRLNRAMVYNRLSGTIPSELGLLTKLDRLCVRAFLPPYDCVLEKPLQQRLHSRVRLRAVGGNGHTLPCAVSCFGYDRMIWASICDCEQPVLSPDATLNHMVLLQDTRLQPSEWQRAVRAGELDCTDLCTRRQ